MYVAGGAGSSQGTGGMITKLEAAKIAKLQGGIHTIIANGNNPCLLYTSSYSDVTGGFAASLLKISFYLSLQLFMSA